MTYRNFKIINAEQFKEELINSKLADFPEDMPADDAVILYNTVLTQLMDKHCPFIKKKIKKNPMPWLDLELRILRRKRRVAERAWRKSKEEEDRARSELPHVIQSPGPKQRVARSEYVRARDEFTRFEYVKRCAHHNASLKSPSGDTKTLYKKLNRLLGNYAQDLPN